MDVCIKNIDEERWRTFKSESAKHGLRTGDFFNKIIVEHTLHCNGSNWDTVLNNKKKIRGMITQSRLKALRAEFRKNFTLRSFS